MAELLLAHQIVTGDKNMVLLEFRLSEEILREDRRFNPGMADTGALSETYFCMPVRMKIGCAELLEMPVRSQGKEPSYWLPLPLLDVATTGLEAVKEAKQKERAVYSLPGSGSRLYFEVNGNEVSVYSQVNGRSARANYDKLLQAFNKFVLKVREVLKHEVPELMNHPYWGKWLKSEIE